MRTILGYLYKARAEPVDLGKVFLMAGAKGVQPCGNLGASMSASLRSGSTSHGLDLSLIHI